MKTTSLALQATFEQYPDSALKDITVSGLTGGSSSRLSRGDVGEVYIPLKRRMELCSIEQLLNQD